MQPKALIVVAGATGKLGQRVVHELRQREVDDRAIVRPGTSAERPAGLREQGVALVEVDR